MQQIAVITLGTNDRQAARRFYTDGFGWSPVFENDEIMFFQMNGLMLGIWDSAALAADMQRPGAGGGAVALAHNLPRQDDVTPLMERLVAAGGTLLRAADAPVHGGFRGYVADPDGHAWEIAWNPNWSIDAEGRVTFGV